MFDKLSTHFSNPKGFLGMLAGTIMYYRPSNRRRNQWMIELLEICRKNKTLLEIGSGPGYALELISSRYKGLKIHALDHSLDIINQAKKRLPACDISFHNIKAEELLTIASTFDYVCTANSHQFWQDENFVLRAILEKLNAGGRLVIIFQPRCKNPSNQIADQEATRIKSELESIGFANVRTQDLPMDPVKAIAIIASRVTK